MARIEPTLSYGHLPQPPDDIRGAPDPLVEILSPSTSGRDLGAKLRQYAKHGVRWYRVIDPERRENV